MQMGRCPAQDFCFMVAGLSVPRNSGPRGADARPAVHAIRFPASDRRGRAPIAAVYLGGFRVIKAPIFGVPIPVARSNPGVVGNSPLLLVDWPIPVMSLKYSLGSTL